MAETIVQCDGCGAHARRRANHPCPEHWFYLESTDRTNPDGLKIYIVWACSAACRDALWKSGPGPAVIDDAGTMRLRERARRKRST